MKIIIKLQCDIKINVLKISCNLIKLMLFESIRSYAIYRLTTLLKYTIDLAIFN
jgi:hypothetical protein